MTIFYSYIEPLSRYSPVTLHLSPATIILNENPKYEMESVVATKKVTLKISQVTEFGKTHSGYEPIRGGSRWKVQGVCNVSNVPVFQMFTELVEYCDATILLSKT